MFEIDENTKLVLSLLNQNGFEAFLVGGCIRDYLLNKKANDIDITTNATPQQICEVFNNYKVIDINSKHGTIIVYINHQEYEITTYRLETTYSDHRRPDKVSFSTSLKDDLKRRDFTINALAYHPSIGLVDYFDGQIDLNNKTIKCIGNPTNRFNEDALRILRALRFSCQLDFTIENNTKQAILDNCELLKYISYERIYDETKKILLTDNGLDIIIQYQQVFKVFLPEINYDNLDINLFKKLNKDIIIRLSFLLKDLDLKTISNILNRLHIDNKTTKAIKSIISNLSIDNELTDNQLLKMIATLGYDIVLDIIQLNNKKQLINRIDNLYKDMDCKSINDLKIDGNDLIKLNIKDKQIGIILYDLFEKVLFKQIKNEKEELLKEVTKL